MDIFSILTGRAWMCVALNEGLMESYFRCFEGNIKLVKKHYVRDALVLDQQVGIRNMHGTVHAMHLILYIDLKKKNNTFEVMTLALWPHNLAPKEYL